MKINNMKRYLSTRIILIALFVVVSFISIPAHALTIDFGHGSAPTSGSISLSSGIYTGTDINIAFFIAYGSGNDGQYYLTGDTSTYAKLNFTTGPSGGSLEIVGGNSILGIPNNTVLVHGTFDYAGYTTATKFSAYGHDTKSPLLLSALGIPTNSSFDFFNFEIVNSASGVIDAHLQNRLIPEPATLFLLGAGLLGIGVLGRMRRKENI